MMFNHHHHKHQGLGPLILSISKVPIALSKVSSVLQLFYQSVIRVCDLQVHRSVVSGPGM
jgi:hypothetical protein